VLLPTELSALYKNGGSPGIRIQNLRLKRPMLYR
jgi:hypothetical protein